MDDLALNRITAKATPVKKQVMLQQIPIESSMAPRPSSAEGKFNRASKTIEPCLLQSARESSTQKSDFPVGLTRDCAVVNAKQKRPSQKRS
jgi:hypothetical protein